jgi:hypothetical protein
MDNLAQRLTLNWVEREINHMLEYHKDILDKDVRDLAVRITSHIDEVYRRAHDSQ